MKMSLTILALVLLGFSQAGFAQAPKEVIVLDGQVAINNGPLNPASVMVENGVTNPVPVLNVTPATGQEYWRTDQVFSSNQGHRGVYSGVISVPAGKRFRIATATASMDFASRVKALVPRCIVHMTNGVEGELLQMPLQIREYEVGTTVKNIDAFGHWYSAPAASDVFIHCALIAIDGIPISDLELPDVMVYSYFGTLVDAPAP